MEWRNYLRDELEDIELDFSSNASIVQSLFKTSLNPNFSRDSQGRLCFPERNSIKVIVNNILIRRFVLISLIPRLEKVEG
jgi:hypothetical protein